MLTRMHCPPDVTPRLPPLSPPASLLMLEHPHFLQSLHSRSALKIYLLCRPQPSLHLLLSAAYHAYSHIVCSQHASDATLTQA
ncbi:hypothetical protein O181_034595 [Austropuccinia psidii MF-1]|uniref:Uncharacterized protein n=1 Tax=Austropuccinia psidii MF-1 TaxID=1389203 RepID=A0A9Q3D3A6_9BASI|nr:hypothetical protein [Austropuccinia psidii MF-1]